MHTKERFHLTVRLLCFGLLLAAIGFRLASILPKQSVPRASAAEPTIDYPALLYEPPQEVAQLAFTESDAAFAPILNWSGESVDAKELITAPLEFKLSDEPTVLIVHTHATESYCHMDGYRTNDTEQNVVRVGKAIADRLNQNGIPTIHDTTLIDREGYYDSYARAEQIIEGYLEKYPTIQMVLDVHRDSATDASGKEVALTAQYKGEQAAQLMFVMGTGASGQSHPNWRQNLSFALKLQALCEKEALGIFRDLNLRSQRYNQHLTPHSVLVEVGSAGNTLSQALASAELLADCLTRLLTS